MPIFKKGDSVCITIGGIEDGQYFRIETPIKEFILGKEYTVKDVAFYNDGWRVLVENSTNFILERYFKFAFPDEMKNIEYTFVQDYTMKSFIDDVNKHIAKGWQLQGGISIATSMGNSVYAQALIKRKNNE